MKYYQLLGLTPFWIHDSRNDPNTLKEITMNTYRNAIRWMMITLFLGLKLSAKAELEIDKEVQQQSDRRPTVESKISYLSSVLSEQTNSSKGANIRISSAIELLGEIGRTNVVCTNVIRILVTNITFLDKRFNGSPASHALVAIGEPAVPELLKVLEDAPQNVAKVSSDRGNRPVMQPTRRLYPENVVEGSPEDKVRWAVCTLSFIKKTGYKQFVDEQKGKLPDIAWEKLKQYGVSIDVGR